MTKPTDAAMRGKGKWIALKKQNGEIIGWYRVDASKLHRALKNFLQQRTEK